MDQPVKYYSVSFCCKRSGDSGRFCDELQPAPKQVLEKDGRACAHSCWANDRARQLVHSAWCGRLIHQRSGDRLMVS